MCRRQLYPSLHSSTGGIDAVNRQWFAACYFPHDSRGVMLFAIALDLADSFFLRPLALQN